MAAGVEFTVSGITCQPDANGDDLDGARVSLGDGHGGVKYLNATLADPVTHAWVATGTAPNTAGSYKVVAECLYGGYANGGSSFAVTSGKGTLVVTAAGHEGTGGSGNSPTAPALPDEPAAGSSTGSVSTVTIAQVSGSWQHTVSVGTEYAGQTVYGTLFSTPRSLGSAVVNAAGNATFTLPTNLGHGAHKLVIQRANGSILGYAPVQLSASGWKAASGKLANTGGQSHAGLGLAAGVALAAGAGLLFAHRRRVLKFTK